MKISLTKGVNMKNKTSENRREFVTEWNAQLEVFAVFKQ